MPAGATMPCQALMSKPCSPDSAQHCGEFYCECTRHDVGVAASSLWDDQAYGFVGILCIHRLRKNTESGKQHQTQRRQTRSGHDILLFKRAVGLYTERNLSALLTTDTDDRLIARAAIIGLSTRPVNGNSTPAAMGTPSAL